MAESFHSFATVSRFFITFVSKFLSQCARMLSDIEKSGFDTHKGRRFMYWFRSSLSLSAANETSLFYFLLLNFHLLLSCHWIRFDEKISQIKNFLNEEVWKDNNGFLHHENHLMSVSFTNENLHYATSVTTKYKSFWWIDTQTEPIHLINQSQLSEKWVVCKAK